MQKLGQYIIALICAAFISGILLSFFQSGPTRSILRLCCGAFISLTALSLFPNFSIPDLNSFRSHFILEGQQIAAHGEKTAREEIQKNIKRTLEEYICDVAQREGAELQVNIHISDTGIPEAIQLQGQFVEATQAKLQSMITKDLGIRKEDQEWIGMRNRE